MTTCPECGHHWREPEEPREWIKGAFLVRAEPPEVYYRGRRLDLTPQRAVILGMLVRRGALSHGAIEMVGITGACEAGSKAVHAQISYIRRSLPEGVRIASVAGWGYRIEGA